RARRLITKPPRVRRARIGMLHADPALVGPQPWIELTGSDVDRVHARGPALQQAGGEPAGGSADVHAHAPGNLGLEGIKCVDELLSATADVRLARPHLDRRRG